MSHDHSNAYQLKAAIARYAGIPAWATVRPPLVELTADQQTKLIAELTRLDFTMPGLQEGKV